VSLLIVANLFWGLSFPVIKALMMLEARFWPDASSVRLVIATVAPRFVLATLLIAIPCSRLKPLLTRQEWLQGLLVGGFAAGGMILQNDGLRFTSASTSAFLTQFYAVAIPIWLALRNRRPPALRVAAACLLVAAGVTVLGHFDWRHLRLGRGEIETLLCSLLFMGQILGLDHPKFAGTRALPVTLVMFGLTSLLFAGAGFLSAPHLGVWLVPLTSGPWLALTAMLTVLATVATYLIMNACQPKISSTEAGLLYCFEPIFGSLLALVLPAVFSRWSGIDYPNELVTRNLLIGGGLITAANLLIQLKPPPREALGASAAP
jgi:drug/metabolite transporter (DMT)-like permease